MKGGNQRGLDAAEKFSPVSHLAGLLVNATRSATA
jgi:hypothetical protein